MLFRSLNKRGVAVSRVFPVGTVMVTIAANIGDTCILARPMCAPDSLVGVEPKSGENSRYLQLCIARRKQWFEARRWHSHISVTDESEYAASFCVVETAP